MGEEQENRHQYLERKPDIHKRAYIAPNATVVGAVMMNEGSSIWFQSVVRADIAQIKIGRNSNIQDGTVVHVDEGQDVFIGNQVTIGHRCIIHSARIYDHALIGMGAILLSGCEIGEGSMVAAGAVVKEGQVIPPNSLAVGIPAKVVR